MRIRGLSALLTNAILHGTTKAMSVALTLQDSDSQARPCHFHGRNYVGRCIGAGLMKISDKKIDRLKLEAIAAASNGRTYLPVADR